MRTLITTIAALAVLIGAAGPGTAFAAGGGGGGPSTPRLAELTQAQAAIEKNDFRAAVPLLEAALGKQPKSAEAWNLLGYAHRKLGQTAKAENYYGKALAIDSQHRGAIEYLGELYLETGRPEQAKKMLSHLESACFFGCEEYDDLKKALQAAKIID